MRVTSPPKHHSELSRTSSPVRFVPTSNKLLDQIQSNFHHLKSPQRTPSSRAQAMTMKESLYVELRNREQEYGQIMKGLNKENHILKAELGRAQLEQTKRSSFTTIMSVSPSKVDMNRTIGPSSSDSYVFRNLENNRVMNQSFSQFNPQKAQHQKVITIRPTLSPFVKKPIVISQHTSPVGYRPGVVTVVSPSKKTIRPVSNLVEMTNQVIVQSPVKKVVNHSYQPSLVSFKYPSIQQSLDCSPKKSFESILGLNSEIFSNTNDSQNQQQNVSDHKNEVPGPSSNFFDMKKRQVNYGTVFQKQKGSQSSKFIQTTLKINTKNFIQNQAQLEKNIQKKEQEESHLNPSQTKRHKKESSRNFERIQFEPQYAKTPQPAQFNLEENIEKNPLLQVLKKRLQQQVQFLNVQNNQSGCSEIVSLFQPSALNPNIRYSVDTSEISSSTQIVHPSKKNIFQAFPLLNQLRSNQEQNEQNQRESTENEANFQNEKTKESLMINEQLSQSNLSDKISRENTSQLVIEEVKMTSKPMTIVRMLEENRRNEGEQLDQKQEFEVDDNGQENLIITDLIAMDRETYDHEGTNSESNQIDFSRLGANQVDEPEQELEEQSEVLNGEKISNRYYCQITQENEQEFSKCVQAPQKIQDETPASKKSIKQFKKASMNEVQNVVQPFSSKKILATFDQNLAEEDEIQLGTKTVQSQKIYSFQPTPCNQLNNPNKIEGQKSPRQRLSQTTQRLSQSSQYRAFYANKIVENCFQLAQRKQSDSNNVQRYDDSRLSDASSQISLRSQKFKKISNRAYL